MRPNTTTLLSTANFISQNVVLLQFKNLDLVMNVSRHAWNTMKENVEVSCGMNICTVFNCQSKVYRAVYIRREVVILCFQGLFQVQGKTDLVGSGGTLVATGNPI